MLCSDQRIYRTVTPVATAVRAETLHTKSEVRSQYANASLVSPLYEELRFLLVRQCKTSLYYLLHTHYPF
jgi:hypothetical protein